MAFKNIVCKLGNMRKPGDWVLYPQRAESLNKVIIQCDKRIAEVDLSTGKAMLSSGKGGHQGFLMLQPMLGATEIDVPADVIAELKRLIENKPQIGSAVVMGADTA